MRTILLTRGQVALVDDADYEWLMQFRWVAQTTTKQRTWYAVHKIGEGNMRRSVMMHRLILNAPEGLWVDHKDSNGLHNWRDNLRLCLHRENLANSQLGNRNTSGFKGVHRDSRTGNWLAMIKREGVARHLGVFATPQDAARAYDDEALKVFGEFARTNAMLGLL